MPDTGSVDSGNRRIHERFGRLSALREPLFSCCRSGGFRIAFDQSSSRASRTPHCAKPSARTRLMSLTWLIVDSAKSRYVLAKGTDGPGQQPSALVVAIVADFTLIVRLRYSCVHLCDGRVKRGASILPGAFFS